MSIEFMTMEEALIADGEKLQQLDGGEHGPRFMSDYSEGFEDGYEVGFEEGLESAKCLDMIEDVREFHKACGTNDPYAPTWPNWSKRRLRADLLQEEANELIAELTNPEFSWENFETHLADTAKEIVDVIYVAIGTALSMGIPLEKVWAEVHQSNMAKVDPTTGKVRRREDGKVLKPEGWQKPNVKKVMFP